MDQLLGVADAARILGVVPATVRQMERDGRLPAQKTASGTRIFRKQDVERLATARRHGSSMLSTAPTDPHSRKEEIGD
jgi:excisionase family DNA binding protein